MLLSTSNFLVSVQTQVVRYARVVKFNLFRQCIVLFVAVLSINEYFSPHSGAELLGNLRDAFGSPILRSVQAKAAFCNVRLLTATQVMLAFPRTGLADRFRRQFSLSDNRLLFVFRCDQPSRTSITHGTYEHTCILPSYIPYTRFP